MITVKVPATTANLGPGFDCLGLAVNLYNTIEIHDDVDELTIESYPGNEDIEKNDNNLIYKSFKKLYDYTGRNVPPVKIVQNINIPISRGLGSSAACIVGGLMAANKMLGIPVEKETILKLATEIEGHPDNVAPALLGGLVVSTNTDDGVKYIHYPISSGIKLMAMIPDYTLSTNMARGVLPSVIDYKDAVFNIGRSSLLTASLITGDLKNLRYAVEDRLHQPYRLGLIPDGKKIYDAAYENGVDAIFISGSGSTLMAVISSTDVAQSMDAFCKNLDKKWDIKVVEIDNHGVQILN